MVVGSADGLEEVLGPECRKAYGGLSCRALLTALAQRLKPVHVSTKRVCDTWLQKYGKPAGAMKRPAAAGQCPALKRPAAAAAVEAAAAASGAQAAAPPPAAIQQLIGLEATEAACGSRYRREVCDLGLGHSRGEMRAKLRACSFSATLEGCREWLLRYRRGGGQEDAGVAVYARHREEILRWHLVEELSLSALQERFMAESGAYPVVIIISVVFETF